MHKSLNDQTISQSIRGLVVKSIVAILTLMDFVFDSRRVQSFDFSSQFFVVGERGEDAGRRPEQEFFF